MSMTLEQTLESYRHDFETKQLQMADVIHRDWSGQPVNKQVLLKRGLDGKYEIASIEGAWWGYREGLKTAWRNGQDESIARRQLYLLGRMAEKFKDGVSVVHQQDQERGDFHISVATSSRGQLTVFRYALGDAIASLAEQVNVR